MMKTAIFVGILLFIKGFNCFGEFIKIKLSSKIKITQITGEDYIKIDTFDYEGNTNELLYRDRMTLPPETYLTIEIDFQKSNKSFGFATLQIHSFYFNVSFESVQDKMFQFGTNLGVLLPFGNTSNIFQLINRNHDEVECMLALIVYKEQSPQPGACSLETNSTLSLDIQETESLVIAKIPQARDSQALSCEITSVLSYDTYYAYIDPLNFASEAYFDGIEKMLFEDIFASYQTKKSPLPLYEFEKFPGRGLIINTVVTGKNGEISFYIPVVTYSCPQNSWNTHCSDISFLRRAISVLLVIHSIVMILNLLVPELIEAIMNGMLIGGFSTIVFIKSYDLGIQGFDYFITIIIGGFFSAAIFGTLALYIHIGRYMTKLTFSCLFMAFIMEVFFETITSPYLQFMTALILSIGFICIKFTFAVLLGGLILIVNLSYLIKVGNLHRILISNFLALTTLPSYGDENYFDFMRSNFINYRAPLNVMDYALLAFYFIGSIVLTMRKEKYFFEHPSIVDSDHFFSENDDVNNFNCNVARRRRKDCIVGIQRTDGRCGVIVSRCRRHHHFRSNVINERSPLISHWLTSDDGDDDVFESPESNSRYMSTLSPETHDRISAVQNFDE